MKLYRSLNRAEKFGIVISQQGLHDKLFSNKKTKQRYLDWAFKMAVKTKFERMIEQEKIDPDEVTSLCFFVDEHTTATNGRYELREALEQEFKFGTYNGSWSIFYPPIFKNLQTVTLEYCNSATKTLIRSADIVANHIFYLARSANGKVEENDQLSLFFHP